jgi:hypothetical protein
VKLYDPPVGPDHEDWIGLGDPEDCPATAPAGELVWMCTRTAGHDGDHAAHGGDDELAARWPAEERTP